MHKQLFGWGIFVAVEADFFELLLWDCDHVNSLPPSSNWKKCTIINSFIIRYAWIRSPLSRLFTRDDVCNSASVSEEGLFLSSFTDFVALLCTFSWHYIYLSSNIVTKQNNTSNVDVHITIEKSFIGCQLVLKNMLKNLILPSIYGMQWCLYILSLLRLKAVKTRVAKSAVRLILTS